MLSGFPRRGDPGTAFSVGFSLEGDLPKRAPALVLEWASENGKLSKLMR